MRRINKFRLPALFSRAMFRRTARKLEVSVGEASGPRMAIGPLVPKEMSTGSLGWGCNEKVQVFVGGLLVWVQATVNLTVIQSKDLPPDDPPGGKAA